jgi:hypothetical protein
MLEAWMNFGAMIFVQLLLFLAFAYLEKKVPKMLPILGRGVLIGMVMGLSFDLVLGKSLGFNSYVLGFGAFFLVINAALSYGIFAATILLFSQEQLLRFCFSTILVTLIYEITNLFFHVWTWQLMLPPIQFLAVLLVGYLGGAFFVVILDKVFRLKKF